MNKENYPIEEHKKIDDLNSLYDEWQKSLPEEQQEIFMGYGFYPHYFSMHPRVLFVAAEATGENTFEYIDELYNCYRNTKYVGTQPLNNYTFHRRILQMAYSILNKTDTNIPSASDLGDLLGKPDGISFAFKNISSALNQKTVYLDSELVGTSVEKGKQFFLREMEILDPQIIILANIMTRKLDDGFFYDKLKLIPIERQVSEDICIHKGILNNREIIGIETYHFSATKSSKGGISDKEYFLSPILKYINQI